MARKWTITKGDVKALAGHLSEYTELLELLVERPGVVVIAADPFSGSSALLATVGEKLAKERTFLRCDARSCQDSVDLAMTVADSVVHSLAREAEAWWMGDAAPASTAGLRLSRLLGDQGTDLSGVRHGAGPGHRLLGDAIDMIAALAERPTLIIDHLGLLISALSDQDGRELQSVLRAARQRHETLDLVLVEHSGGPIGRALRDPDHPLFRAGEVIRVLRPRPDRFAGDLTVTRAWADVPVERLTAAAELAAGVPFLAWQTLELAEADEPPVEGWKRLRMATEPTTAQQWDLLRGVHRQAQAVIAAMSVGLRPHSVPANAKSVNDALVRLRDLGYVWQPKERTWAVANPLLKAWARDHPPSWARRRSAREQVDRG